MRFPRLQQSLAPSSILPFFQPIHARNRSILRQPPQTEKTAQQKIETYRRSREQIEIYEPVVSL